MKKFMVYGLWFMVALFLILYTIYYIPSTNPVHAQVDIGKNFGFGDVKSLGEGTSRLIVPGFSVATIAVIIYFLFGAFFYLKSGGNKEEIESAKKMITHAIIGFIILIFAFLVLQFLLSSLFEIKDFRIIK